MSKVYVMEVGSLHCPGDTMITRIMNRELQSVCVPHDSPMRDEASEDNDRWVFLKPSSAGVGDVCALQYVTLAVRLNEMVAHDGADCDCEGRHDECMMGVGNFEAIRRISPVRVAYSNGRGPYPLPVGDEANLKAALVRGRIIDSPEAQLARRWLLVCRKLISTD
jgi:hypothetical protein